MNHSTYAQSVGINIGWYYRVNPASAPSDFNDVLSSSPLFSFELHSGNILRQKNLSRIGVRASLFSMKSKPIDPSKENAALKEGEIFRLVSFLIGYQRKVLDQEMLNLMLNLSGGLSFRGSKLASGFDHCDTPFCNLPKVILTFQSGLTYIVGIKGDFAAQVNVLYNLLLADTGEIFPFSSGLFFEAGLMIEPIRTKK